MFLNCDCHLERSRHYARKDLTCCLLFQARDSSNETRIESGMEREERLRMLGEPPSFTQEGAGRFTLILAYK